MLPSKGLLYPEGSELAKGEVAMKYMTAKEEDILTNESYIKRGVVLDELFKSMILSKINYDDLLIADRNAIMVAARVLSYGPEYELELKAPSGVEMSTVVNLSELAEKEFDTSKIKRGTNEFEFTTSTGRQLTFKLLNVRDEREIKKRIDALKKVRRDAQVTSRLKQMITSVDGDTKPGTIHSFVDNEFLVTDTRKFRKYVNEIQPNIDFEVELYDEGSGNSFRREITFDTRLFWPDASV
jgi:hypothetical protein